MISDRLIILELFRSGQVDLIHYGGRTLKYDHLIKLSSCLSFSTDMDRHQCLILSCVPENLMDVTDLIWSHEMIPFFFLLHFSRPAVSGSLETETTLVTSMEVALREDHLLSESPRDAGGSWSTDKMHRCVFKLQLFFPPSASIKLSSLLHKTVQQYDSLCHKLLSFAPSLHKLIPLTHTVSSQQCSLFLLKQ